MDLMKFNLKNIKIKNILSKINIFNINDSFNHHHGPSHDEQYNNLVKPYIQSIESGIIDHMESNFHKLDDYFQQNENKLCKNIQQDQHKFALEHYKKVIPHLPNIGKNTSHYEEKKKYHQLKLNNYAKN